MELQAVNDTLKRCLDDLEERIDPQEEDAILQAWRDFSENRFHGDIFLPHRSRPNPPQVEWPHVSVNTALGDFDADGAPAVRRRLEDAGRWGRRGAERALQLRLLHRAAALRRRSLRDGRRVGDAAHLAAAQRQGRHPPADRRGRARSAHRLRRARHGDGTPLRGDRSAVPQDRQVRLHLPPGHAGADGYLRGGVGQHDLLRRAG